MPVKPVLKLGNPNLREPSLLVHESEVPSLTSVIHDLHDTLMDFRLRFGAGRAIAAPQIGVGRRLIYMHIDKPVVLINPIISGKSNETFEVWDDCLCFPELLVRVARHKKCGVTFRDMEWNEKSIAAEGPLSELLQHEIDHLDGILATDRAIDSKSFAWRGEREAGIVG
jgi:peptide deformylase